MKNTNILTKKVPVNNDQDWYDNNNFIPFPHDFNVEWCKLNVINKIVKNSNNLALEFKTKFGKYILYLSFPKKGGIRLYSNPDSFFSNKEVNNITFSNSKNTLEITSKNNLSAKLISLKNNWSLNLFSNKKENIRIYGDKIYVGYNSDGVLKKSIFPKKLIKTNYLQDLDKGLNLLSLMAINIFYGI